MEEPYVLTIPEVYIEQGKTQIGSIRLRRFQEEVLEFLLSKGRLCVLLAYAGAGKTLTVVLPIYAYLTSRSRNIQELKGRQVLALYPTRELVEDQYRSIIKLLGKLYGCSVECDKGYYSILSCKTTQELKKVYLVKLTSETLDKYCRDHGIKYHTDALMEILNETGVEGEELTFRIIVLVPDILHLILAYIYGSPRVLGEIVRTVLRGEQLEFKRIKGLKDRLSRISNIGFELLKSDVVFFDEFHFWTGVEYVTALAIIYLLYMLTKCKIVVSSATLDTRVVEDIRDVTGEEPRVITARIAGRGDLLRVSSRIEVYGLRVPGKVSNIYTIQDCIPDLVGNNPSILGILDWCRKLKGQCMIIVDRVYDAVLVKDILEKKGFNIALRIGPQRVGDEYGADVIVGNRSIEIGIDNPRAIAGIVYAKSSSSLIQRLHRIGRCETKELIGADNCKIAIITSESRLEDLKVKLRGSVGYEEFLKAIEEVYPEDRDLRSILRTPVGLLILYTLCRIVVTSYNALLRGGIPSSDVIKHLETEVNSVLERLGWSHLRQHVERLRSLITSVELDSEELHRLFTLRSGGVKVKYTIEYNGEKWCGEYDLMILLRNFKLENVVYGDGEAMVKLGEPMRLPEPLKLIMWDERRFKRFREHHGEIVKLSWLIDTCRAKLVYSGGNGVEYGEKLLTIVKSIPVYIVDSSKLSRRSYELCRYLKYVYDVIPVYLRHELDDEKGFIFMGKDILLGLYVSKFH